MATEPHDIRQRIASERGAILIQVGVAILVLSAFSMFIIDYGALWIGRHQAQNAADAGAIAGATALAFDDFDDRSDTGPAKVAAETFTQWNSIWGEAPDPATGKVVVRFYPDAPGAFPASCVTDDCVRVDVYRNQEHSNPLPTFFGHLVGVNEQGVRAMAIARAAVANASKCIKPWAVPDKWQENTGTPETFDPTGANPDVYVPQNGVDSSGTGYTPNDVGTELILKPDINTTDPFGTPGWFQELSLPSVPGPKSAYEQNIFGCTTSTYTIGETVNIENLPGNRSGPTIHGTETLLEKDPFAEWDSEAKKVVNSCVEPPYSCTEPGYKQSPRIVTIPVFNTQHFYDTGGPGKGEILIQQFLGFFVDRIEPSGQGQGQQQVVGILATTVGLSVSSGGSVASSAAFLHTVQLVR